MENDFEFDGPKSIVGHFVGSPHNAVPCCCVGQSIALFPPPSIPKHCSFVLSTIIESL